MIKALLEKLSFGKPKAEQEVKKLKGMVEIRVVGRGTLVADPDEILASPEYQEIVDNWNK